VPAPEPYYLHLKSRQYISYTTLFATMPNGDAGRQGRQPNRCYRTQARTHPPL